MCFHGCGYHILDQKILDLKEYDVLLLHGDMDQIERNKVITNFKKQECNIMVATDVAGELFSFLGGNIFS